MSFWPWRRKARRHHSLFPLGQIVVSEPARAALRASQAALGDLLDRHQRGDWGQVDDVDAKQNELALRLPLRLRSVYVLARNDRWQRDGGVWQDIGELEAVWVITSADRRRTRVLLPREIFDEGEWQSE